jgi:hypothetical protein
MPLDHNPLQPSVISVGDRSTWSLFFAKEVDFVVPVDGSVHLVPRGGPAAPVACDRLRIAVERQRGSIAEAVCERTVLGTEPEPRRAQNVPAQT